MKERATCRRGWGRGRRAAGRLVGRVGGTAGGAPPGPRGAGVRGGAAENWPPPSIRIRKTAETPFAHVPTEVTFPKRLADAWFSVNTR